MGKRTSFKRIARDFYPTPMQAVLPLLRHLPPNTSYAEPCAGDGRLISHLYFAKHTCVWASDIEPQADHIKIMDVLNVIAPKGADYYITNPPWSWPILKDIIPHLSDQMPTWLLLNADLAHNKRMAIFMKRCHKIVSVGRVSWMGNGVSGYENTAWFLFDKNYAGVTEFYAR